MSTQGEVLPGTLGFLILKAVLVGSSMAMASFSESSKSPCALLIEQGALYPALFRLVRQGLLKASWGTSETIAAPSFTSSPPPAVRLREEREGLNRLVTAMASALGAEPEEA